MLFDEPGHNDVDFIVTFCSRSREDALERCQAMLAALEVDGEDRIVVASVNLDIPHGEWVTLP